MKILPDRVSSGTHFIDSWGLGPLGIFPLLQDDIANIRIFGTIFNWGHIIFHQS